MASLTAVFAVLSLVRVPKQYLTVADPVSLMLERRERAAWPRLVWRRAGLIAAEYLASPSVPKDKAARIMLYCILKVPDAPRLQLAAAEFIGQYRHNGFEAETVFAAIARRFSNNSDAQRALMRVLTRVRGKRLVLESLLQVSDNESLSDAAIRAQCLEDLGEFGAADLIWNRRSMQDQPTARMLYAESLTMRGYLGKAIEVLEGLEMPESRQQLNLIRRRLDRAGVQGDPSLYVPGVIAQQCFEVIREDRKTLSRANRVKKIVLINASLGRGGAERQCVNTAIAIAKNRPDMIVEVWVRNLDPRKSRNALLPELKKSNIRVRAIERFSSDSRDVSKTWPTLNVEQFTEDLYFLCPTVFQVYNGLNQHRPDVVHLWQDATISLLGLGALWARIPNIALSFRSIPPHLKGTDRPYYQPLLKGIVQMPGVAVSANTAVGAASYADWLGIDREDVSVISNGLVRSDLMNAKKGSSSVKTIVGIMRLDENKRPDAWVKVASEILKKTDNVKFSLLGDGPLRDEIEALVLGLHLEDRIQIMGDVRDVGPVLAGADLLLHLAYVEGMPNVVIEAQAFGCAVVATDAGGTKEAFIPGKTGVLLGNEEKLNVTNIAEIIVDLITNQDQLESFQAKARAFAQDKFSMETMLDNTLRFYGCAKHSSAAS